MSIFSAHRGSMSWSLQYFFQDWDDAVDDESLLHTDQEALPALTAGDINVEPSADIPDGEPVTTACTQTLSLHQTKSTQMDTADLRPSESRGVSVGTESFQPQHDRQQPQSCHCDSASMQVALTEFRGGAKYDNDMSTLQHDNKALHEYLRDLKNKMEILVDLKNKVSEIIELSRNMENGVRTDQQNIVDSPPTSPPHRLPFHTIDFDESTDNILHGMARASVSPAQPRPGRTIEPVLARNSTRIPNVTQEVDPISRAIPDCYSTWEVLHITSLPPGRHHLWTRRFGAFQPDRPRWPYRSKPTGYDKNQGHNQKTIW